MIKLEKISVKFGGGLLSRKRAVYALRDITTDEITSSALVIGESGAGKTTLGKVILGLIKPSEGTYYYKGVNVWKNKRKMLKIIRREIQYIAQDPFASFNPNKTVGESIGYVVKKYYGRKNYKERVIELLKSVGLSEREFYKYPHQLSGGQLQRANIARALVPSPKILVADEPTSMLDASLRLSIVNLLANIIEKNDLKVIMITHDLGIAKYFYHKVKNVKGLILYKGRLVEEGDFLDILEKPLHPYTKFLKENIIDIASVNRDNQYIVSEEKLNENGCPFYPFCSFRVDICKNNFPPSKSINNRKVACYHYA
ncbi:ABC transporter ATP-binding protein [Sulfurisphaera tokodaii]|uniref:Cellobiose ABC transporter ATP-binding protein n=2 Tax=Sulfurisphaera tokodaii TaxID=111955 RepID=Q96XH8_SULTO|nr:oligopeptide/dipeptide ABC transporter ATP-binding protein [Sulfurisphaera tokodaii]BAB67649.1 cellobiose ABC transporter ATP-binding protein [Sulfurisphaera tokodaii str. 7]HII75332.1 ATP-binding cassette domain-containing protein [Sulfurisphaera tokodaii]